LGNFLFKLQEFVGEGTLWMVVKMKWRILTFDSRNLQESHHKGKAEGILRKIEGEVFFEVACVPLFD
jgi:hypothetical protein